MYVPNHGRDRLHQKQTQETMKIGVAITTYNRHDVLDKSIEKWRQHLPDGADLIVVDDGSTPPHPLADYRFSHNSGIASAKNKCIELLLNKGCTHLFLADSDTWPVTDDWYVPYIKSNVKHLSFTFTKLHNGRSNGHTVVSKKKNLVEYSSPCGCMIYIHSDVINKIGGFDVDYPQWGYEHADFSRRAYNAGITPSPYLDVSNSLELFHSMDYFAEVCGSVNHRTKAIAYEANKQRFENTAKSTEYMPYINGGKGVILASYFNSVQDPQRGKRWNNDGNGILKLYKSAKNLGLEIRVFHDCITGVESNEDFVYVNPQHDYAPNVYRWLVYRDWLESNEQYEYIFMVDSTDVEVLRNPFLSLNPNKLYVGDEHGMVVDNNWMRDFEEPYMTAFDDYRKVISENGNKTLINCGIVGGSRKMVINYLSLAAPYIMRTKGTLKSTDMSIFNYTVWKHIGYNNITHGVKVNTRFKYNEYNSISFFKHK